MGSSYHRASLEIRERAFALFKLGYGYKHSAEELGVNVHTVRDWFRMFRRGHSDTVFNIRSTTAYDLSIRKKVIAERRRDNTPFAQLSEEKSSESGRVHQAGQDRRKSLYRASNHDASQQAD